MMLFASKLSLGEGGNPIRNKIYDLHCDSYGEDEDVTILEDEGEEEVFENDDEDEIKEYEEEMKRLIEEFRDGRLRQGWGFADGVFSLNLHDGIGSIRDENGKLQPTPEWVCGFMRL